MTNELKPIGFITDDNNPNNNIAVYFKDEVIDYINTNSTDDAEADQTFKKYWLKNTKVLLIVKSEHGIEYQKEKVQNAINEQIKNLTDTLQNYETLE